MAVDWQGIGTVAVVAVLLLTVGYLPDLLGRRQLPKPDRPGPPDQGEPWWHRGVLGEPTSTADPERFVLVGTQRPERKPSR